MSYQRIQYPKRHFLKELKQLLRNNRIVEIELKPLFGKKMLYKSVKGYLSNQGFSFAAGWFFLIHLRLLYALLVLDAHNYEINLDENGVICLTKDNQKK